MNNNTNAVERDKADKRTMQKMDEQYKNCPIRTNTYEVEGVNGYKSLCW